MPFEGRELKTQGSSRFVAYHGCVSSAVLSSSAKVLLHELSPSEDWKGA